MLLNLVLIIRGAFAVIKCKMKILYDSTFNVEFYWQKSVLRFQWQFVPMLNPDGYNISHQGPECKYSHQGPESKYSHQGPESKDLHKGPDSKYLLTSGPRM